MDNNKFNLKKIDNEFYANDEGYIRITRYGIVGWRHLHPVLGYFRTINEAAEAIQSQPIKLVKKC